MSPRLDPDEQAVAEQFGRNVRRWRLKKKLSGDEVARRADLNRTTVWHIENGQRLPGLDILVKLAGAFGIEPEELLRGIGFRKARGNRQAGLYIRGRRKG